MDNSKVKALAESALAERWRQTKGNEAFRTGPPPPSPHYENYVKEWKGNLLCTVPIAALAEIEQDYDAGAGHELKQKFCAAYSSSALAANCFGRFRKNDPVPSVAGTSGLMLSAFEEEFRHGLSSQKPTLDVTLRTPTALVAVESKCTEYLQARRGEFKDAYDPLAKSMEAGWQRVFETVRKTPDYFGGFDAAQLVKHYLGISTSATEHRKVLLYLFWEPRNADSFPAFAEHRRRLGEFSKMVEGSKVEFQSQSYPELWESWASEASPKVSEHLRLLKDRYLVTLSA